MVRPGDGDPGLEVTEDAHLKANSLSADFFKRITGSSYA